MIGLRSKKTRTSNHDVDRRSWRNSVNRCEQLIRTLPIPEPFDVPIFLSRLADRRGRRIELMPADLPTIPLCGMLISTDEADYIFHAVDATPLHTQHIDMHEVGHLLLGHPSDIDVASGLQARPDLAEQDTVRTLLPSLSPALIRRVLGRTTYSHSDEREAELFASLLLSGVVSPVNRLADRPRFAEHLSRLWSPTDSRSYLPCAA